MRNDLEYARGVQESPLLRPRKGDRIRLQKTGDPPPGHYVRQHDLSWLWGVGKTEPVVAMNEDAALDAAWKRFRERSIVPEAGALVLGVEQLPASGIVVVQLQCRNGGLVGYPIDRIERDWETY